MNPTDELGNVLNKGDLVVVIMSNTKLYGVVQEVGNESAIIMFAPFPVVGKCLQNILKLPKGSHLGLSQA